MTFRARQNYSKIIIPSYYIFGISDREPHQQTNKWIQARGYSDAINYVTTLSHIDTSKIILWGESMITCEIVVVAAIDRRE